LRNIVPTNAPRTRPIAGGSWPERLKLGFRNPGLLVIFQRHPCVVDRVPDFGRQRSAGKAGVIARAALTIDKTEPGRHAMKSTTCVLS
jgi:hypothetical protein